MAVPACAPLADLYPWLLPEFPYMIGRDWRNAPVGQRQDLGKKAGAVRSPLGVLFFSSRGPCSRLVVVMLAVPDIKGHAAALPEGLLCFLLLYRACTLSESHSHEACPLLGSSLETVGAQHASNNNKQHLVISSSVSFGRQVYSRPVKIPYLGIYLGRYHPRLLVP